MKCNCGGIHKENTKCQYKQDPKIRKIKNKTTLKKRRQQLKDPLLRVKILTRDNKSRKTRMKNLKNRKHRLLTEQTRLENPETYKQKLHTNNNYYINLKENHPEQYKKRLEQTRIFGKVQRKEDRMSAIQHYGNECMCPSCPETNIEFLGIDHIDGGGTKHRKEIKGKSIYRWLRLNKYPKGFRTLCHNCNMSYGFYGYCPHNNNQ